ncbi:hypothetical protein SISSUDRAFT_984700 [Sistotremastrum suecicum HHB10207 ss-3]|uniref:Uncharacterized protein n=1 Tax=Sistotremastrum suecicum HHB10207 ss-3 TaxID=1314776 RepID=A0A166EE48_9AGAM|nr:hypothetical protein SISSUDRAFT_984700 [Sistotremastrum suecicum HHB10207 ss-3]
MHRHVHNNLNIGFKYLPYSFIGDAITLTLANGKKVAASYHTLRLRKDLRLTYGQIISLARDFYGTYEPISDGATEEARGERFIAAFNTLANGEPHRLSEAMDILDVLQKEIDEVNEALDNHQNPSFVYSRLPDLSSELASITSGRKDIPGYVELARMNWDCFGEDALIAYRTGHSVAISKAINDDLEGAYAMNAFADRFLGSCFSAGFLRTSRRLLHLDNNIAADVCAKFMQDEDNAIGLSVTSRGKHSWKVYGNRRTLDSENEENLLHCVRALQSSADEIYAAYRTRRLPSKSPNNYTALKHVPLMASARSNQNFAPLFTFDNERRQQITSRNLRRFTTDWNFRSTILECETSGLWTRPISIDDVHHILPGTALAVVHGRGWDISVFCQRRDGRILQYQHYYGTWTNGVPPVFNAVLFTPLAAVSWNEGKCIRVYHLDENYIVQEYCTDTNASWYRGRLGDLGIKADHKTSIAAICHVGEAGNIYIRVYLQETDSNVIREYRWDGSTSSWSPCWSDLPVALRGTSLAAITHHTGHDIRLYYQTEDLTIREYRSKGNVWSPGHLDGGKTSGCAPIRVVRWEYWGGLDVQVYWQSQNDKMVGMQQTKAGWRYLQQPIGTLQTGNQFVLTSLDRGRSIRLYYQHRDSRLREMCCDHGSWFRGEFSS